MLDTIEAAGPPHNIQAEQQVVGALLYQNSNADRLGKLGPEDFYDPLLRQLYALIVDRIAKHERADYVTLGPIVASWPRLGTQPIPDFLRELVDRGANVATVAKYADELRAMRQRRVGIEIADEMRGRFQDINSGERPSAIVEDATTAFFGLAEKGAGHRSIVSIAEAMSEALTQADAAYQRGDGLAGLSTGIASLDARTGGLCPEQVLVLAGRPAMGKTALALNIAMNVATAGTGVVFFSLEMSGSQLASRIISSRSNVPAWAITRGKFNIEDRRKMDLAQRASAKMPLWIATTGGLSIPDLANEVRRMRRLHGIGLVVIDYMQLMRADNRHGSKVAEVTEISNGIKALAKEVGIPIIALSQLSRKVEDRDDKRPQLADLRESGSIEQDADAVVFAYREAYYLERQKPDQRNTSAMTQWAAQLAAVAGRCEAIVAKNRHGPTGTAELAFDGRTMTFSDAPEVAEDGGHE